MSPSQSRKVLFLCTGNSCRSQMAEGLLRHLSAGRFDACSAGLAPQDRIHPLAIHVMAEIGIDISGQKPKSVKTYLGKATISYIITVCTKAEEDTCPRIWPGVADINRLYWPFDDPVRQRELMKKNNKSSGWSGIHSGRKSLTG